MLTVVALGTLLGGVAVVMAAVARLVDRVDRRRWRRVTAQIRVTDTIHGALGAVVAPTVTRWPGGRWAVTMGLGPRDIAAAGRLVELADHALGREDGEVRVIFTPRG